MITPAMVLETIKVGFEFGIEALKFAQTPEGKQLIAKSIEDRAAWDAFWADTGAGLKKFFSGEILK